MRKLGILLAAVAVAALLTVTAQAGDDLKPYKKVAGISGNLSSVGSDTLNNLMTYWAEKFRENYPNVNIQIEGKGSSTAPPALIEGTAQLGPMSRKMKSKEEDDFQAKYGFKPTRIGVALDCIAVYLNKDNPCKQLSMEQLDGMYSKTHKSGHSNIETWGQVDPAVYTGTWAKQPISLYGRNSASGTYGYFKKHALFKGDYKDTVKEQPGSAAVVMGVTEDLYGVGYSGIGYKTSGVKCAPLSKKTGEKAYPPTYENALSGKYPLARLLYVHVVKEPGKKLPPLIEEFIKLVLSKEGQEIVKKEGAMPLPGSVAEKQLKMLAP